MKKLVFIALCLGLSGCASAGIVKLSPDTYMLMRSSAAGMFANMSTLKAKVIQEANKFAEDQGKIAIPLATNEVRPTHGFPSFEYQFRVIDKNDYEARRTHLVPGSGTIIQRDEALPSDCQGTGFLLAKTGLIVTNYHVVEERPYIKTLFPKSGKTFKAKVVLKDVNNDIIILQLSDFNFSDISEHSIPYSVISSDSVKMGQDVFTLGFPLGEILGKTAKLSSGKISALYGLQDDPRLFQISNPIQPGNSGGALFSENGELVGIVVASLNARYFYERADIIPQNVNFAIKSNYLVNLISMLPEEEVVMERENLLGEDSLEKQIDSIFPFVVTVIATNKSEKEDDE